MAAAYSERFFAVARSSGAGQVEYTVPSGKRAIVRQVTFVDVSIGGTGGVGALVGPGSNDFLIVGSPLAAAGVSVVDLHLVFYAGEDLRSYRVSGTFLMTCHGYLLDDP